MSYFNDGYTIEVNDLLTISNVKVMVKELFILNSEMHISYIDDQDSGLLIEKANDFIEKNKNYFENIIKLTNTAEGENCCGCENNK